VCDCCVPPQDAICIFGRSDGSLTGITTLGGRIELRVRLHLSFRVLVPRSFAAFLIGWRSVCGACMQSPGMHGMTQKERQKAQRSGRFALNCTCVFPSSFFSPGLTLCRVHQYFASLNAKDGILVRSFISISPNRCCNELTVLRRSCSNSLGDFSRACLCLLSAAVYLR
jgi:hypothetical protein